MWLLPAFSTICRISSHVFYRVQMAGDLIPAAGPVLLVANHPNSLFDPVLVSAAANRRVRFLAKAPLFSDPVVGWLVRGVGAIPVYRRVDDPTAMAANTDTFRAAHEALASGAAIGIFPEGISHNEPELAALKTGAARIAIGTLAHRPGPFPIIPVGLVFRRKEAFRSAALVVRGAPVPWDDLAEATVDDRDAVRELTQRIERGMRLVTVNLERWEDRALVDTTEAIWAAEREPSPDPAEQVRRLGVITAGLSSVRRGTDPDGHALVEDVSRHGERLARLRLSATSLASDTGIATSARWLARRFYLASLPAMLVAATGYVAFLPPYYITDLLSRVGSPSADRRSTHRLLIGILLYGLWIVGVAIAAGWLWGPVAAIATAVGLPLLGRAGLWTRERWRSAGRDARRFFTLRSRRHTVAAWAQEQRGLADRLERLYHRLEREGPPSSPD